MAAPDVEGRSRGVLRFAHSLRSVDFPSASSTTAATSTQTGETITCTRHVRILVFATCLSTSAVARAHEPGAPFSGAILDPLELHHAHIENDE